MPESSSIPNALKARPSPSPQSQTVPSVTGNLFWGRGEGEQALSIIEGTWPTDIDGYVFIVGPDKRKPDGHWFFGHGLLCRIACKPDAQGKIRVRQRLVDSPMKRLRDRFPKRFHRLFGLLEASPFGFTNFANTNVQAFGGRLFLGYDVGRPVEVDPVTLDYLTPVGSVDEWAQVLPAPVEPMITVAAHPAPDWDERSLYFVNYVLLTDSDRADVFLARWDLEGGVQRWKLEGMSPFDSIHDVKATRDYLVITDLPFVQERGPQPKGGVRERCQSHTHVWIVKKADLLNTLTGGSVKVKEVRVGLPTGHLTLDYAPNERGEITVYLQHIQGTDLTLAFKPSDHVYGAKGEVSIDPNFYGLPAFGPQPTSVGRYRIDPERGVVLEARVCTDPAGVWGPLLATSNQYSRDVQQHSGHLFFGGMGFDPALLSQRYAALYKESGCLEPALDDLPKTALPGGLSRFDLSEMRMADVYHYAGGAFPHPLTFVPRKGMKHELDGYILAPIQQNGAKEIHVFDAAKLSAGPIARATAPDFCPPLLLHSYWMAEREGPRPSRYHVSRARDTLGALKTGPGQLVKVVRAIANEVKKHRQKQRT